MLKNRKGNKFATIGALLTIAYMAVNLPLTIRSGADNCRQLYATNERSLCLSRNIAESLLMTFVCGLPCIIGVGMLGYVIGTALDKRKDSSV